MSTITATTSGTRTSVPTANNFNYISVNDNTDSELSINVDGTIYIKSSNQTIDLNEIQMMYNFLIFKGYINKEEFEKFKRQFKKLEEQ